MHDSVDLPKRSCRKGTALPAILTLAAALCLFVMPVMAHAPADMTITLDPDTDKISVTITHPVDDPATHYVKEVRVKLNELVISDPAYRSQPTKDTFTYTYDVNAHPGDTIRVTATCVLFGTLEKMYTVPEPVSPTTRADTTTGAVTAPPVTRAAAGFLPLIGAVFVMFCRRE